jgi:hypothetical protein
MFNATDWRANRWEAMPPMESERGMAGAAALKGTLYALGGWNDQARAPLHHLLASRHRSLPRHSHSLPGRRAVDRRDVRRQGVGDGTRHVSGARAEVRRSCPRVVASSAKFGGPIGIADWGVGDCAHRSP